MLYFLYSTSKAIRALTVIENFLYKFARHYRTSNLTSVSIEPHLQPLSGEALRFKTANSDFNARLDIVVNGFWDGRFERSFFYVRVFNPGAPSNCPFKSAYHRHEKEKRCQYEQRA